MTFLPGVFQAKKKNGTIYYRSSITIQRKHISLGSFPTEKLAHEAYKEAMELYHNASILLHHYSSHIRILSFEKFVCLINFRDNQLYIKNPIYLRKNYFSYFLSSSLELKFDIDDLFYYSSHKIMQRKGHLFVSDYGMQVNILSRYGIKNYAVAEKDYLFLNQDSTDYRYQNIQIINPYYGVQKITKKSNTFYQAKIHICGDYIIGNYKTEIEAAIAYNKAVDQLKKAGLDKNFQTNFICELNGREYAEIYTKVELSKKISHYTPIYPK